MADPVVIPALVKSIAGSIARMGLAGRREGPSPEKVLKSSPAWDDPELLSTERARIERISVKGPLASTQRALLRTIDQRLAELPEPGGPPPGPGDELPGDELPGDELEDEYTDEEEAEDEWEADLENEAEFSRPDYNDFDPTEQAGDPARRRVESELPPFAFGGYADFFVEPRRIPPVVDRPRSLPRGGTRIGSPSGAIVYGIIELIKLGRQLYELQTETLPEPAKGPRTRPKGRAKVETLPDPEPILVRQRKRAPVRMDETTRRVIEKRNEALPELEEIRVTLPRRSLPPSTRPPKVGQTQKAGTKVGLATVLDIYRLFERPDRIRTIVRDRVPIETGDQVPEQPEVSRPGTTEPPTQLERVRVEQTMTQATTQATRTRDKKCVKERENRVTCYKGFFRERKNSTAKKRWKRIDCVTGKEIRLG